MQRREEIRPSENPPWALSSAWSAIVTARQAGVLAAALIGFTICRPAAAAVCHVPAAVLCEGCAERLSIRVTPGGACRITFTAPASPASTAAAKFVDIDVKAEPARPARHRAPRLSDAKPEGSLHPQGGCFIFNGRRFCE